MKQAYAPEHSSRATMPLLIFLIALNLRPTITSIGPLLPLIGAQEGLNETTQGLLGSLPLFAFAAVSFLVPFLSAKVGTNRAILIALILLSAGAIIRSYTGHIGLWLGTLIIGCVITICNVLIPVIVKRNCPKHISRITGIYSAGITISAALASAMAVPLATFLGWQGSLACWALPPLIVALIWLPQTKVPEVAKESPTSSTHPTNQIWKQPLAWIITIFFALQSIAFYTMITWSPTIEASYGTPISQGGLHLFIYQFIGMFSGLAMPKLIHKINNHMLSAAISSAPMTIGIAGILLYPTANLLWIIIFGLGAGASFVVGLSLFSMWGRNERESAQLSGMAQTTAYLLAALGPVIAGYLTAQTGSWQASLVLLLVITILQSTIPAFVGIFSQKPNTKQSNKN